MPRRKLARRFEPRYSVNQVMLDIESKYVGRELQDKLIHSTNELKENLAKWQSLITKSEQELSARLDVLRDQERLALRGMLARDFWHMAKLYLMFLGSASIPEREKPAPTAPPTSTVEAVSKQDEVAPVLPFKNTLFE